MLKGMAGDATEIEGSGFEELNRYKVMEDFPTVNDFNHAKSSILSEEKSRIGLIQVSPVTEITAINDLDFQIQEMMEKSEGV